MTNAVPNIYPGFRYLDAPAAMKWLAAAFGFEEHFVVPGPDGTIAHAQMRLGSAMIMLGTGRDDRLGFKTPREAGCVTGGLYVYVPDVDASYARAKAAGAEMIYELRDTEYGSREFACRDPEGYFWSFGTYDPTAHA